MPFWWNRRKKYWGTRRYKYRTRNRYRKRRPRFFRHRHRRATRRRRRRRKTKVRRKKPFIKLLQWQPDAIRKCKIIGLDTLLLGANGKQFRNYVTAMNEWTPPTVPTGGGFSTTKYSLAYLYEQFQLHNNIWTTSNSGYDLCRYTGAKIRFYRHLTTDFIIEYIRQYPMTITEDTYGDTHPHTMLLKKHKLVIPSIKTNPYGKRYITKKLKPPKQQVNKWFFQDSFNDTGLLMINATACDLNYAHLGEYSENELTSFLAINNFDFYTDGAWGHNLGSNAYKPWSTFPSGNIKGTGYDNKPFDITQPSDYNKSVDIKSGWFQSTILRAKQFTEPALLQNKKPLIGVRYNPKIDTGEGNYIWLSSIQTHDYNKPSTDKTLIAHGKPLWKLLYGWTDYVKRLKKNENILLYYYLLLQSPYFRTTRDHTPTAIILPIDDTFIQGTGPYSSTVTAKQSQYWYPTLEHQQQTINNIVKCGPYITRPEGKKSNWELHIKYCFYFKWGGALQSNTTVADPSKQTDYPVPDQLYKTIQVTDPKTNIPASLLHTWDFRRGFLTKKALKRMYEHLPIESTLSTDSECSSPHKKIKISKKEPALQEEETETTLCLQQLCEGDTYQEIPQEENSPTIQLIKQQQQQQQLIKHNLLTLLTSLKKTQLQMQMHTGILE
nr:MAG: ORF1 [Torque teno midi virus]